MLLKHPKSNDNNKKKNDPLKTFNPTEKQQSKTGPACLYIWRNVCWLTSYKLNERCHIYENGIFWLEFTELNNPMTKQVKIDFDYLEKNVPM